jgi:hypothetical protein
MKDPILIKVDKVDGDGAIWCGLYKRSWFSKRYHRFGHMLFHKTAIDWETWRPAAAPMGNICHTDFYKADNDGALFSITTAPERTMEEGRRIAVEPKLDDSGSPLSGSYESMFGVIPSVEDQNTIKAWLTGLGVPVHVHPHLPEKWRWKFGAPLDGVLRFILWVIRY